MNKTIFIPNEAETLALGKRLSELLSSGLVITLQGDLGAGKTTLARGILRGLGVTERVKSPTYTLVESYDCPDFTVNHFDCYRLTAAEQLNELGLENYFTRQTVCLIEWPEQGKGVLPATDLSITLVQHDGGRQVTLTGVSQAGHTIVGQM